MQHGVDMACLDDCCTIFHRIWFMPQESSQHGCYITPGKSLSRSLEPCHATMITWRQVTSVIDVVIHMRGFPDVWSWDPMHSSSLGIHTQVLWLYGAIHKCCCHKMTMYRRPSFLGEFKRLMRCHEGLFKSISHAQCRSSFNFSCSIKLASKF